jgi:hypothetical protein
LKAGEPRFSPTPPFPGRGPARLAEPVLKIEKILEEEIQQKTFAFFLFLSNSYVIL